MEFTQNELLRIWKAANAGVPKAMETLAELYRTGIPGVPANENNYHYWLKRASAAGSQKAREVRLEHWKKNISLAGFSKRRYELTCEILEQTCDGSPLSLLWLPENILSDRPLLILLEPSILFAPMHMQAGEYDTEKYRYTDVKGPVIAYFNITHVFPTGTGEVEIYLTGGGKERIPVGIAQEPLVVSILTNLRLALHKPEEELTESERSEVQEWQRQREKTMLDRVAEENKLVRKRKAKADEAAKAEAAAKKAQKPDGALVRMAKSIDDTVDGLPRGNWMPEDTDQTPEHGIGYYWERSSFKPIDAAYCEIPGVGVRHVVGADPSGNLITDDGTILSPRTDGLYNEED